MRKMVAKPESQVIDASNLILGRMASIVAKKLLIGEKVTIVNAEQAVISGRKDFVVGSRKEFLSVGSHRKGPIHPKRPDTVVKRTIRGMLPWRQPKGKEAYGRLRVYTGFPEELRDVVLKSIPEANAGKLRTRSVTVGEVMKELDWKTGGNA